LFHVLLPCYLTICDLSPSVSLIAKLIRFLDILEDGIGEISAIKMKNETHETIVLHHRVVTFICIYHFDIPGTIHHIAHQFTNRQLSLPLSH
jgi:hypothetical protein